MMSDRKLPSHMSPHLLAMLAQEMAEEDPVRWDGLHVDPALVYDVMSSQVANLFAGYEKKGLSAEAQLRIALAALVKINVETFALALRVEASR